MNEYEIVSARKGGPTPIVSEWGGEVHEHLGSLQINYTPYEAGQLTGGSKKGVYVSYRPRSEGPQLTAGERRAQEAAKKFFEANVYPQVARTAFKSFTEAKARLRDLMAEYRTK